MKFKEILHPIKLEISYIGYKEDYTILLNKPFIDYWYFVISNEKTKYKFVNIHSFTSKEECEIEAKKFLKKKLKELNTNKKSMKLEDFKIGDVVNFTNLSTAKNIPNSLIKQTGEVVGFTKTKVKVIVEIRTFHIPPENLIKNT